MPPTTPPPVAPPTVATPVPVVTETPADAMPALPVPVAKRHHHVVHTGLGSAAAGSAAPVDDDNDLLEPGSIPAGSAASTAAP